MADKSSEFKAAEIKHRPSKFSRKRRHSEMSKFHTHPEAILKKKLPESLSFSIIIFFNCSKLVIKHF